MRDGYSIVINRVNLLHAKTRGITEALTRELGEAVQVNVYVSWRSEVCFLTNWDDHDVLVVQSEGAKFWEVFRPTRKAPTGRDTSAEIKPSNLELAWSGTLKKGDVLYIPKEWWHHARSEAEGSIHLTAGFTNRTALEVVEFIADLACRQEVCPQDLLRPGRDDKFHFDRENLRLFLARLDVDELLAEFWNRHYQSLPGHAS